MDNHSYRRRIKKDYHGKKRRNPFFARKPKESGGRLFKCSLIFGILLLIFLFWFFLASSFWRFQNLRIEGLTRADGEELKRIIWNQATQRRWLFLKQDNIFLFDAETAIQKINAAYNLAGVEIKKTWPRTLDIKVNERPYAFIFQEGTSLFYASGDGYIIKEPAVNEADKKKYFILENKKVDSLIDAKNRITVERDYFDFIFKLSALLTGNSELAPEKFIISQEANTLTVKFLNGPTVYFNTAEAAAGQVELLLLVKREKIKDNFSKTNYIDLRYGDKIFINPEFK